VARALAHGTGLPLDAGHGALLLEVELPREIPEDPAERWRRGLRPLGLEGPVRLYEDADELWRARGQAGVLMDREVGPRVREDVAVPLSKFDELVRRVRALSERRQVPLVLYAHLGEGSLHPNFLVDPASPAAAALRRELWRIAWSLGGTASAEHGLGAWKAAAFSREHGTASVRVLRALKSACDPDGILNPGKFWG
jgi:FAD/FMN-containing dehydrogenase